MRGRVTKKKIVIADDSHVFLTTVGPLLKKLGFSIVPAENGVEVLKIVKLLAPDVVLLDVNMEMMDGLSVLRFLKADSQTSRIPVIMVSSDSGPQTVARCRDLGCSAYLLKPVDIEQLQSAIENSLSAHACPGSSEIARGN